MSKVKNSHLFRLAAVLYADNNYEVTPKTIHRKVIESALVDNDNKELSVHELITYIEKNYWLIFDEAELITIVTNKNDSYFNIGKNSERELLISLTEHRKQTLEKKLKDNTIDDYITEFAKDHTDVSDTNTKELIYRFLYQLINTNITGFSRLFSKKHTISDDITIENLQFSESDKDVISRFINWDNDGKNKAIFDIASYGIEYCMISNNYEGSVHLDNLRNKIFYLDTNVIFRALGINGDNRRNRTLSFLEMFSEAKEQLLISKFTDSEFKATVKYYVNKINLHNSRTIDPRVFLSVNAQSDFFDFYHKWRIGKTNTNLSLFESHILALYDELIKRYKITVDYNIPFDDRDDKVLSTINELASNIIKFKSADNPRNTNGSEPSNWDAKNIYLLEKRRNGKNDNIFDTKYFFISTDQGLRRWDFQRRDNTPIVILPSQWMSILLRYVKRTSDDYKSFVSFLNLPHNDQDISYEKLQLILTGISEITDKVESQSAIVNILVSRKFTDVIHICLVDTGMRLGEMLKLRYEDVNFDTNLITIWINKGGRPRSIPMTKRVRQIMLTRQESTPDMPFHLNNDMAINAWQWVRKEMGLEHDKEFVLHALRHTCASRLLNKGADIVTIRDWLGHADIATTMIYAHLQPNKLAHAAVMLDSYS